MSILPAFVFTGFCFQHISHGILEELEGNVGWHDFSLTNIVPDKLAVLGALTVLLGTQEIASFDGGVRGERQRVEGTYRRGGKSCSP